MFNGDLDIGLMADHPKGIQYFKQKQHPRWVMDTDGLPDGQPFYLCCIKAAGCAS